MESLRATSEIEHSNPGAPRLPRHPFRGLFVGESGSGKTQAVIEHLILDPQSPFERVIWCAPAPSLEQPIVQHLVELHEPATDADGVPGPKTFHTVPGLGPDEIEDLDELINSGHEQGLQTLLAIDDCICEGNKREKQLFVDRCFTSGRHKNLSTILLTQRIFTPELRTARVNTDVFWVASFSDKTEAKRLFQQLSPGGYEQIMSAYRHATVGRGPGSALYIDKIAEKSTDPSHKVLRFRRCGTAKNGSSLGLSHAYSDLATID